MQKYYFYFGELNFKINFTLIILYFMFIKGIKKINSKINNYLIIFIWKALIKETENLVLKRE